MTGPSSLLCVRSFFCLQPDYQVNMATAAEKLAWVEAAIQDVLENGQHIAKNGKVYTKADLKTLQDMEKRYEQQAEASAGTSGSFFARSKTMIPRRS
jgi:nicotinic acid mononucleotide adenylyltransferase